ncbi:MAG: hypothetical protein AMXMBFR84_14280 [Candidatus Hydrogenedentota bacterium]
MSLVFARRKPCHAKPNPLRPKVPAQWPWIASGGMRSVVSIVLLVVLAQFFVVQWVYGMAFYLVPTESMQPTLEPKDRLVTLRSSQYRRGDVVVARDPLDQDSFVVKRIVAVAGDTVSVSKGRLHVNGRLVPEPYLIASMYYVFGPITIRQGEVFLLGDNRNASEDGHIWQQGVPIADIMGKVTHIYYPFGRSGKLPSFDYVYSGIRNETDFSERPAFSVGP